jgi:hypothetical protein
MATTSACSIIEDFVVNGDAIAIVGILAEADVDAVANTSANVVAASVDAATTTNDFLQHRVMLEHVRHLHLGAHDLAGDYEEEHVR